MSTPLRVLLLKDSSTEAEVRRRHPRDAGDRPARRRMETETEYLAHLEPALALILADCTRPHFLGRLAFYFHLVREPGLVTRGAELLQPERPTHRPPPAPLQEKSPWLE